MTNRLITHLRHVDLAVPDYTSQRAFYTSLWGLTTVGEEEGLVYLAAEGSPEQYIVRLRKDADKRLDLMAFGAANREDVDTLAQRLGSSGVQLISEPDTLQTFGGGYGFRFFDIDGRTVEVSSDVATREHRKIEARESIPVRLSHVVVNSPDLDRTLAFYEKELNFALSDTMNHPLVGDIIHFARCNGQHHSLGISRGPYASLNHVSFEMRGLDEYMRGTGRLMRAGTKLAWGPGRHAAGDNTFSYFIDPSGNTMEYTTELELLDEDTWHPSVYDVSEPHNQDQWGTANGFTEETTALNFNDVDRGLFVAPPV